MVFYSRKNKKAQITVFIIIGLVILFFASAIFIWRARISRIEELPLAPEEIRPVANYIELCIQDVAKQGVVTLGMQGGYIKVPDYVMFSPDSYVPVVPNSPVVVPLWYFRGQSRIPTLEFMQDQIAVHVNENLKSCLDEFESLKEQFSVRERSDITTDVVIGEQDVLVKVNYRLRIKNLASGASTTYANYGARLPVKLKRVYDLAKQMMEKENEDLFFERAAINLMVLDPDVPFSDMQFTCTRPVWYVDDVTESLKTTLFANMPTIRVDKTDYPPFSEPIERYQEFDKYDNIDVADIENINIPTDLPGDLYEYTQLFWRDVVDGDYSDLDVMFTYDRTWPLQLIVRPSKSGVMKASSGRGGGEFLRFMCINTWHFTYDVDFPVMGTISDDTSFYGGGYSFNFVFPVLIDHNEGNREVTSTQSFVELERPADFCDVTGEQEVVIRVKDIRLQEDLKDASVKFVCGKFECELGKTIIDPPGYKLRAHIPTGCTPGALVAERNGYLKNEVPLAGGEEYVTVSLHPLLPFNLNVQKRSVSNIATPRSLSSNERALVRVYNDQIDYNVFAVYPDDEEIGIPDIDAVYDIDVMLLSKDYTGEETISGTMYGNWTVTRAGLAGKTTVMFNVVESPRPGEYTASLYEAIEDNAILLKPTLE